MKKLIVIVVFALFAFFATAAYSQANFTLSADVPFSFSIEGRPYAPGPYYLRSINSSTVLLVNMVTGDVSVAKLIPTGQEGFIWNMDTPKLRFVLNGERANLVSLVDGYGNGWQVPVTSNNFGATLASGRKPS